MYYEVLSALVYVIYVIHTSNRLPQHPNNGTRIRAERTPIRPVISEGELQFSSAHTRSHYVYTQKQHRPTCAFTENTFT